MKAKVLKCIGVFMIALCLYHRTVQAQEISQQQEGVQAIIQSQDEDALVLETTEKANDSQQEMAADNGVSESKMAVDEVDESVDGENQLNEVTNKVVSIKGNEGNDDVIVSSEGGTVSFRSPANNERHYTIKSGDSLWAITNKFGLTMENLLHINGFADSSVMIHPGQILKISDRGPEKATQSNNSVPQRVESIEHVIQRGDSLWRISQQYKITLDELLEWNNFSSLKVMLHPGQTLIVSQPQKNSDTQTPQTSPIKEQEASYSIQSGDSFWKIANLYGMTVDDLLKLNGFSSVDTMIHPGQVLKVKEMRKGTNPSVAQASRVLPQLSNHYYQNLSRDQKNFLSKITKASVDGWSQYQILPSVTLGQAIIESAWGSSKGALSKNNYFGVMDGNGNLKQYASVEEGFKHRFEFLQHYKGVVGNKDYRSTLRNIHAGGYATAPDYAQSLIHLIDQYGLTLFDNFVLGR